jgi:hypothetical protein
MGLRRHNRYAEQELWSMPATKSIQRPALLNLSALATKVAPHMWQKGVCNGVSGGPPDPIRRSASFAAANWHLRIRNCDNGRIGFQIDTVAASASRIVKQTIRPAPIDTLDSVKPDTPHTPDARFRDRTES